jgi:hypothetical protein
MARFDFKRRRRTKDGPPKLGLVVAEKATNSEELMLRQQLHLAIMAETKGLCVIFELDEPDELRHTPDTAHGEDPTFGNQIEFMQAMGLTDRYPSQAEALAWMNEIEVRQYAIWWPKIEAAMAKGSDRR